MESLTSIKVGLNGWSCQTLLYILLLYVVLTRQSDMLKIKDRLGKYKALLAFPICLFSTFKNLQSSELTSLWEFLLLEENEFLKEQTERSEKIYSLDFRYADWVDYLLMFLDSLQLLEMVCLQMFCGFLLAVLWIAWVMEVGSYYCCCCYAPFGHPSNVDNAIEFLQCSMEQQR